MESFKPIAVVLNPEFSQVISKGIKNAQLSSKPNEYKLAFNFYNVDVCCQEILEELEGKDSSESSIDC